MLTRHLRWAFAGAFLGGSAFAAALLVHAALLAPHALQEPGALASAAAGALSGSLWIALPASFAVAAATVLLEALGVLSAGRTPAIFRAVAAAIPLCGLALVWSQFRAFEGQLSSRSAAGLLASCAGALVLAGLVSRLSARWWRSTAPPSWRWALAAILGASLVGLPIPRDSWPGTPPNSDTLPRLRDKPAGALSIPPPGAPQTVVLLTVDTLRADHTGFHGYGRDTTPLLDTLASEGVSVAHMSAATTCTVPSTVSIHTGLQPWCTGVYDQFMRQRVGDELVTLAERFRARGYKTGGFVANPLLSKDLGIHHGFERFTSPPARRPYPTAEVINMMASSFLRSSKDEPVFLWLHYMDPHYPYVAEPEAAEFENDALYSSRELPVIHYGHRGGVRIDRVFMSGNGEPSVKEGRVVAHYDGEILHFDTAVAQLLGTLADLGRLDDTLVAFTADHGESLGDHGLYYQHCQDAYQANVHVPAIFWGRGVATPGRRIEVPAGHVDIAPTLLGLVGIGKTGDRSLQGIDLLAEPERPGSATISRRVYSQSAWWDGLALVLMGRDRLGPTRSVVEGDWKYVLPRSNELSRVRGIFSLLHAWRSLITGAWRPGQLYHLASDPGEVRDRAADHPELAAQLHAALEAYPGEADWQTCPVRPRVHVRGRKSQERDARIRNQLEALGYLE